MDDGDRPSSAKLKEASGSGSGGGPSASGSGGGGAGGDGKDEKSGPSGAPAMGKLASIAAANAAAAAAGALKGNAKDNSKDKSREAKHKLLLDKKVIDEKVIADAVRDEILSSKDGKLEDFLELQERNKLTEVSSLLLSFKQVHVIDNLQGFTRLIKLQLDNNLIERISGLDHLVHLQWLDLSFNHIAVIEGLDRLTQLTDLSLFHNHIKHLTGLTALKNLNVLSVGNNSIRDVTEILELRPFKHLRLLNLKGNPVADDPEYHNTVFAYLPNLKYLDYQSIEPAQRKMAEDAIKSDHKEKLESEELARDTAAKAEEKKQTRIKAMNDAGLEGLHMLYDDVLKADAEWSKIQLFPDVNKVMDSYRGNLDKTLNEFINIALDKQQNKDRERKIFESVYSKLCARNEAKSREKIQNFDRRKKQMFRLYDETKKQFEELKRQYEDARRANPNSAAPQQVLAASLTLLTREMEKWTEREGEVLTVTAGFNGTGAGAERLWGMTKDKMLSTVKDMLYRKESLPAANAPGSPQPPQVPSAATASSAATAAAGSSAATASGSSSARPNAATASSSSSAATAAATAGGSGGVLLPVSAANAEYIPPHKRGGLEAGDTRDLKYELQYFGINSNTLGGGGLGGPPQTTGAASQGLNTPGANASFSRTQDLKSPLSPSAQQNQSMTSQGGYGPQSGTAGQPPATAAAGLTGYALTATLPLPATAFGIGAAPQVPALYNPLSAVPPHKQLLEGLKREVYDLNDQLMDFEALLTEQLNGVIDQFEAMYKVLKDECGTRIASLATHLQEICTQHFEALAELHRQKLDKLQKEELLPRPTETVIALLTDKDAVNHSLEASKNTHSGFIGETESELTRREEEAYSKLSKRIHMDNIKRRRQRIHELTMVTAKYMLEIDPKLDLPDDDD